MMLQNSLLCSYNHEAIPRQYKEVPCIDHLHISLKLICLLALLSSHTCILTQTLVAMTVTSEKFFGPLDKHQMILQMITTSNEGKP